MLFSQGATEIVPATHPLAIWAVGLARETLPKFDNKGGVVSQDLNRELDRNIWASPYKRAPDPLIWGIETPEMWAVMGTRVHLFYGRHRANGLVAYLPDEEVLFLAYDAFWPGISFNCPHCHQRLARWWVPGLHVVFGSGGRRVFIQTQKFQCDRAHCPRPSEAKSWTRNSLAPEIVCQLPREVKTWLDFQLRTTDRTGMTREAIDILQFDVGHRKSFGACAAGFKDAAAKRTLRSCILYLIMHLKNRCAMPSLAVPDRASLPLTMRFGIQIYIDRRRVPQPFWNFDPNQTVTHLPLRYPHSTYLRTTYEVRMHYLYVRLAFGLTYSSCIGNNE